MSKDRKLERAYSLNVARLSLGKHEETFDIGEAFFTWFDSSLAEGGKGTFKLEIEKFGTHLDVHFHFSGRLPLNCDRCNERYEQDLSHDYRIIYSFDKDMDFEGYEVMFTDSGESQLNLMQEFFDIISMAIPIRKVPPKEIHLCAPEILAMLGLDENGDPIQATDKTDQADEPIDPRWEALRKLKGDTD
ncbi:MAG: DUF177 domain-containing protein [Bacteroidota bacterium]